MLESIPPEVVGMILSQVTGVKDLQNLCRVSKGLYAATMPLLYGNITLGPLEWGGPVPGRVRRIPVHHMSLTRHLTISTPPFIEDEGFCIHHDFDDDDFDDSDNGLEWDRSENTDELGTNLLRILERLPDNGLRNFCWELGYCVPETLLGFGGYLCERQTHLEMLSLITNGDCPYNTIGKRPLHLSGFKSLRVLSWIGLKSVEDFRALRNCLRINAKRLEGLKIDLISWTGACTSWYPDFGRQIGEHFPNFLAKDVFEFDAGSIETRFRSLKELSLSSVSFEAAMDEILYGFDFSRLRKLKLWCCPHAIRFLSHITSSKISLKLTSFEFVTTEDLRESQEHVPVLNAFLRSFEGLEDYFLLLPEIADSTLIAQGALHHEGTLRRLILHSRSINDNDESDHFEQPQDQPLEWTDELGQLLLSSRLESIGMCFEHPLIYAFMIATHNKPLCRVLHLRASGSSELRFGKWIDFGAEVDNHSDVFGDNDEEEGENQEETDTELDRGMETTTDVSTGIELPDWDDLERLGTAPGSVIHFAQWAFGPEGLENLEILAYGDFCHRDRYERSNFVMCRNELRHPEPSTATFRELSKSDERHSWLYKSQLDFLGACPADTYMGR